MNDGMGAYVASQLIKAMIKKSIQIEGARVLIMGLTFKENCPDLRNTRVVDVLHELTEYNLKIDVFDPWVDAAEAEHEYGIRPISEPKGAAYDAVVLAVAHEQFKALGAAGVRAFAKPSSVIYDLKYVLPADSVDLRL
jgi:UDP-N-acetyl-D-glucosamine/UDP-N-acetyl-D-galactosamine dehydrogenase